MPDIRDVLCDETFRFLLPHLHGGSRLASALTDLLSSQQVHGQPRGLIRSGSTRTPDRVVASGALWDGPSSLVVSVRRRCEAIVKKEMARPRPLPGCKVHGVCRVCKSLDHVSEFIWRQLAPAA
jgi:hypothetical protein